MVSVFWNGESVFYLLNNLYFTFIYIYIIIYKRVEQFSDFARNLFVLKFYYEFE